MKHKKIFITHLLFLFNNSYIQAGVVDTTIGSVLIVGAFYTGKEAFKEFNKADKRHSMNLGTHSDGAIKTLGNDVQRLISLIGNGSSQSLEGIINQGQKVEKKYGKTIGYTASSLVLASIGLKLIFNVKLVL